MNRFAAATQPGPRTARPRTAAVVGALLVPLLAAAILVGALWNPQDRLDQVTAAIVNDDVPVEVDGQLAPLGRQLAAALVGGATADDGPDGGPGTGYTWVLTDAADAAAGLRSGGYTAVVRIPEDFSAAATSAADPAQARRATIEVTTSERNRLVDDAVTQVIAAATTDVLGTRLTTTFLDNLLVGFTTLGEELGAAADGAADLAAGAGQLADGTAQLAEGQRALAEGAAGLADGTAQLAAGTDEVAAGTAELSDGAAQLAGGARGLADGTGPLSDGASALAAGTAQLAEGTGPLADGAARLSAGLGDLRTGTARLPQQAAALARGASDSAAGASALADLWQGHAAALQGLADDVCAGDPAAASCAGLQEQAAIAAAYAEQTAGLSGGLAELSAGTAALADPREGLPALAGGVAQLADAAGQVAGGAAGVDDGATGLASGARQLAGGIAQLDAGTGSLAAGTTELAAGVRQLAGGTAELGGGAQELSTGAAQLAQGTEQSAAGAGELADGAAQVGAGTAGLAEGLGTAVDRIPTYDESERRTLADVVADPVATSDGQTLGFGRGALALFTVLALWLGALGLFAALPALPADTLGTTRSPVRQAVRAFALPAAVGAGQGLAVTAVVAGTGELAGTTLVQLGLLAAGLGVVFAAVNQALVAWFGGAGRLVALGVALVVLAAGVVTAVPGWLTNLEAWLPVGPAVVAVQAVVQDAAGGGGAVAALVVWGVGALVATALAVARRRTARVRTGRRDLSLAA
jgi:putative membrane protein